MREAFTIENFTAKSLEMIGQANEVLTQYEAMGYDLSLRQLYYQFVSRNWLPNSERSYKNLGDLVSRARLAGMLDWGMIRDRGRSVLVNSHWSSPKAILRTAAESFALDKWHDQPAYCMVMVEKRALEGVLIPVCQELDVPFTANTGYASSSHLYDIAQTIRDLRRKRREPNVFYLGDHDPSGLDMTRDVRDRLELLSRGPVAVHRVALNMDQIEQYSPPENPAKTTDSRSAWYIAAYGESSWELDALDPSVLADLVRDAVVDYRDDERWLDQVERESRMREELKGMAEGYREV